jgi:hypothetical protein
MEASFLIELWKTGGWQAVIAIGSIICLRNYFDTKNKQDKELQEDQIKATRALFGALQNVSDMMIASFTKQMGAEEAANALAAMVQKRVEAERAAATVAAKQQ